MPIEAKRVHYRVSSGPCHDALLAWREERNAIQSKHWEFAKSNGASGLYPGSDDNVGNGIAIHALIFEGALPEGWKSAGKAFYRHGDKQVAGKPDKRTAIGKALVKEIAGLPRPPHSDRVLDKIGFPARLDYENEAGSGSRWLGFINALSVGYIKDVFYIALPDLQAERQAHFSKGDKVTSPDWQPLDGMEAILKEEADLDFARAKLADAS